MFDSYHLPPRQFYRAQPHLTSQHRNHHHSTNHAIQSTLTLPHRRQPASPAPCAQPPPADWPPCIPICPNRKLSHQLSYLLSLCSPAFFSPCLIKTTYFTQDAVHPTPLPEIVTRPRNFSSIVIVFFTPDKWIVSRQLSGIGTTLLVLAPPISFGTPSLPVDATNFMLFFVPDT